MLVSNAVVFYTEPGEGKKGILKAIQPGQPIPELIAQELIAEAPDLLINQQDPPVFVQAPAPAAKGKAG